MVAVLALIAASDPQAAWVQVLVYAMVVVTVVSGADYFLNFRRRLEEVKRRPLFIRRSIISDGEVRPAGDESSDGN